MPSRISRSRKVPARSYCGTLHAIHVGRQVLLQGWVHRYRDHGRLAFVDLRDHTGIIQVVVDRHASTPRLAEEWVVQIQGIVRARPAGEHNARAGHASSIEVHASCVEVLNVAADLPFRVGQAQQADTALNEELRLSARVLALREPELQRNLRLRSAVTLAVRRYLARRGFVEVETPVLANATPEGARDFLVPSRLHPATFYALPQSPQQFKQLCMVGGLDRYFQIARCFRDEDLRSDRQPEFTQIDVEMSFTAEHAVQRLVDGLLRHVFTRFAPGRPFPSTPLPSLTYREAIEMYGTDKPDLRFDLPISPVPVAAQAALGAALRQPPTTAARAIHIPAPLSLDRLTAARDRAGPRARPRL